MTTGDFNGQTWVKNMKTGDERFAFSGAKGGILGWVDDKTVILSGFNVFSLNLETLEKKVFFNEDRDVGLAEDNLVYQQKFGSITLRSIIDNSETTLTSTLLNQTRSFQGQGPWVAAMNQVKDGQAGFSIVIYNIDTKQWRVVEEPDNMWLEGCLWLDDSTLLVPARIKGSNDQSTFFVNVNELPVLQ